MDIYAKRGTKVIYDMPNAGYPSQQDYAKQHLIVGRVCTVDFTEVHSSSTDVYLIGVPGSFNSVLFGSLTAEVEVG